MATMVQQVDRSSIHKTAATGGDSGSGRDYGSMEELIDVMEPTVNTWNVSTTTTTSAALVADSLYTEAHRRSSSPREPRNSTPHWLGDVVGWMGNANDNCNKISDRDCIKEANTPNHTIQQHSKDSHCAFLRRNANFRLYLCSYIINFVGDWLTYLSSLAAIEAIQYARGQTNTSGIAVSRLVMTRLLPNVFCSPLGGVLADMYDRRHVMIALDLCGATTALLFILAVQIQSIALIYIATFLQQSLTGLCDPSRTAMVALLARNEHDLKMATTLAGLAWSAVAAFGSATGGFLVAALGLKPCFLLDSLTYLSSAILLTLLRGQYVAAHTHHYDHQNPETAPSSTREHHDHPPRYSWEHYVGQFWHGIRYIRTTFFGPLVFLNGSASLVYGGFAVLNVAIAERGSLEGRSLRLGTLYMCIGIGCWVGPLVFDRFTDISKPVTLQLACLYCFAFFLTGACTMFGISHSFWVLCLLTSWRSAGSAALWISSTLLLQKFSPPSMLGRVMAVENIFNLTCEAFSAYMTGILRDRVRLSVEEASLVLAGVSASLTIFWSIYHWNGGGARAFRDSIGMTESQNIIHKELSMAHTEPVKDDDEVDAEHTALLSR